MTVDVFVNRSKADEFLRRGEWPQVKAYLQKEIHDDAHRQTLETFNRLPARKIRFKSRKKIVSWSSSTADPAFCSSKESGDSSSMNMEHVSSSASASASAATPPNASTPSTASSASADAHPCCSSSIPAAGGASAAAETAETASSSTTQKPRASTGVSNDGDCIGHPMITRAKKRQLENPAEDDDEDETRCGICLYPFTKGEKLKTLHCKHEFHSTCIHQWLLMDHGQCFCPMCRTCVKCGIPKYRVNIVFFERRGNKFHRLQYLE